MGTYLSTPAAEKYKEWGEDLKCLVRPMRWAVVDMQGWRKSMEDAHCIETTVPYPPGALHYLKDKDKDKIPKAKVFGVFDGHGGPEVARFCQLYLVSVLMQQKLWTEQEENSAEGDKDTSSPQEDPSKSDIGQALIASFHALDRMIDDPERRNEIIRLRTHKAPPTERRDAGTIPPEKPVEPKEAEIPKVMNLAQDANAVNVLPPPPPPPPTPAPTPNTTTTEDEENETKTTAEDEAKPEAQSTADEDEKEDGNKVPESTASSVSSTDEQSASLTEENTQENTDESMPREEGTTQEEEETQKEQDEKKNSKEASESSDSENSEDYESDEAVGTVEAAKEREREAEDDDDSKDDDVNINPYEGGIQVVEAAGIDEGATDPAAVPANKVTVMFQRLLNMNENQSGQMVVSIADPDEPVDVKSQNSNPAQQNQISAPTGPSAAMPSIFQNGRLICNLPDHPIHAGCTAVVAVLLGMTLTVANAGDSRAVLCRQGGVAEPLSFDHKPQQPREMNRISNAGGFVNRFGRVNGNLNLSRSIGDLKYKQVPGIAPKDQMITAEPDILQVTLNPNDEFVILGCDGIWDCLTNEKCVEFVRERIDTKEPKDIGEEMLNTILSDDPRATQGIGGDNMTVLIIDLQPQSRSYAVDPAWGPPTSAAL